MKTISVSFPTVLFTLLLTTAAAAQTPDTVPQSEGKLVVVSSRVGTEIDLRERNQLGLFPNIVDFRSASCFQMPDSSFRLVFTFAGKKLDSVAAVTYSYIRMLSERIDHWEALQAGRYRMGSTVPYIRFEDDSPVDVPISAKPATPYLNGSLTKYEAGVITTIGGRRILCRDISLERKRLTFTDEDSVRTGMPLDTVGTIVARTGSNLVEGALVGGAIGLASSFFLPLAIIVWPITGSILASLGPVGGAIFMGSPFLANVAVSCGVGMLIGALIPKESIVYQSISVGSALHQPETSWNSPTPTGTPLFAVRIPLSF